MYFLQDDKNLSSWKIHPEKIPVFRGSQALDIFLGGLKSFVALCVSFTSFTVQNEELVFNYTNL